MNPEDRHLLDSLAGKHLSLRLTRFHVLPETYLAALLYNLLGFWKSQRDAQFLGLVLGLVQLLCVNYNSGVRIRDAASPRKELKFI